MIMKKRSTKKLRVSRDTIRTLDVPRIGAVAGGVPVPPTQGETACKGSCFVNCPVCSGPR